MMTAEQNTVQDWLRLIQAEYLEMPGLALTRSQVQKLWGLDASLCDTVLDTLLARDFLEKAGHDTYVLARDVVTH